MPASAPVPTVTPASTPSADDASATSGEPASLSSHRDLVGASSQEPSEQECGAPSHEGSGHGSDRAATCLAGAGRWVGQPGTKGKADRHWNLRLRVTRLGSHVHSWNHWRIPQHGPCRGSGVAQRAFSEGCSAANAESARTGVRMRQQSVHRDQAILGLPRFVCAILGWRLGGDWCRAYAAPARGPSVPFREANSASRNSTPGSPP